MADTDSDDTTDCSDNGLVAGTTTPTDDEQPRTPTKKKRSELTQEKEEEPIQSGNRESAILDREVDADSLRRPRKLARKTVLAAKAAKRAVAADNDDDHDHNKNDDDSSYNHSDDATAASDNNNSSDKNVATSNKTTTTITDSIQNSHQQQQQQRQGRRKRTPTARYAPQQESATTTTRRCTDSTNKQQHKLKKKQLAILSSSSSAATTTAVSLTTGGADNYLNANNKLQESHFGKTPPSLEDDDKLILECLNCIDQPTTSASSTNLQKDDDDGITNNSNKDDNENEDHELQQGDHHHVNNDDDNSKLHRQSSRRKKYPDHFAPFVSEDDAKHRRRRHPSRPNILPPQYNDEQQRGTPASSSVAAAATSRVIVSPEAKKKGIMYQQQDAGNNEDLEDDEEESASSDRASIIDLADDSGNDDDDKNDEDDDNDGDRKPPARRRSAHENTARRRSAHENALKTIASLPGMTEEEVIRALQVVGPPYGLQSVVNEVMQARERDESNKEYEEESSAFQPNKGMKVRCMFQGKNLCGAVTNDGRWFDHKGKKKMMWEVTYEDGTVDDDDWEELYQIRADRPLKPAPSRGRQLQCLELFSGSGIITQEFCQRKWKVASVDSSQASNATVRKDIMKLKPKDIFVPDFIWARPPFCETNSLPAGGARRSRRKEGNSENTAKARDYDYFFLRMMEIMRWAKKKHPHLIVAIENPGGLLKDMPLMKQFTKTFGLRAVTVHHCAFGRDDMKPTMIWTNDVYLAANLGEFVCENKCRYFGKSHPPSTRRRGRRMIDSAGIPLALAEEVAEYVSSKFYMDRIRYYDAASLSGDKDFSVAA